MFKTALGDATFREARSPERRASPCFSKILLSFMPFTTNTQRCQQVCFSPGRRDWEPLVRAPAGLHAVERAAPSPTWVGNPWAKILGRRPPSVGRAASSLAIPAEAGDRGCHTPATLRPHRRCPLPAPPGAALQRAPATPSAEGGRLQRLLFFGIKS